MNYMQDTITSHRNDMIHPPVKNLMLTYTAQKLLLLLKPETAHNISLSFLRKSANTPLAWLYTQKLSDKPVKVMGLNFPNPVGLAAGFDKDGEAVDAFHAMGFGHVEVGTVTPRAQPGNPSPRLFRIKSHGAIINRMGFNNLGVENLKKNLLGRRSKGLIGVNIGKNKDTPLEKSKFDYLACMDTIYDCADYITVNISSPNTAKLRTLQFGESLEELLHALKQKQEALSNRTDRYVPLALKISPDLTREEVTSVAQALLAHKIDGVVATNTTLDRTNLSNMKYASETGGLSGAPLKEKATLVIKLLKQHLKSTIPIIAVGGIMSSRDAHDKIAAGAKLIQIYSGLVMKGPGLIKEINDCRY